jgi:hypothetical protein
MLGFRFSGRHPERKRAEQSASGRRTCCSLKLKTALSLKSPNGPPHVAAISVAGSGLDVLGSLYLAYDLLGGQHGPLRLLTRAVTYSIVFGVGYGLGLGLFFGVVAGVTTGLTIAIELNHAARGHDHYPLPWEGLFGAIRGAGLAVGLYPTLWVFASPSPLARFPLWDN